MNNLRKMALGKCGVATAVMTIFTVSARSQISTVNGYLQDSTLAAATASTSIVGSSDVAGTGNGTPYPAVILTSVDTQTSTFGINGPTGTAPGLITYAATNGYVTNGVLDTGLDLGLSTTGLSGASNNLYSVNADVSFQFVILPAAGGSSGGTVLADYTGDASIMSSGPAGAYSLSYVNATIEDYTENEPEIEEVGLSLFGRGDVPSVISNSQVSLIAGDTYTVNLTGHIEEDEDNLGVDISALIDPQLTIDPSNPDYSIAFSPGLPGNSGGSSAPDATSTLGLLAFGMGAVSMLRRRYAR
jgi:hypothetical protein